MRGEAWEFDIDMKKTVLSSTSLFFKTENFIKETRYVSGIDELLIKICEMILLHKKEIIGGDKFEKDDIRGFRISLMNNEYCLFFKFGYLIGGELGAEDIVFYNFVKNGDDKETILELLHSDKQIRLNISREKKLIKSQEFNRLYQISRSSVNLPRLSKEQRNIVETVDKHIVVQGVAGSGKTNVCIDKIIFTACKNFQGKVLYTTFSRGLLMEAQLRVSQYKKDLEDILSAYQKGNLIFLDNNKKKALENRLGIFFFSNDDNQIFDKVSRIIDYLNNKVDFLLIEDLYRMKIGEEKTFVGEDYFVNSYCKNITNYQVEKALNKLSAYSKEVIFKEIFGVVLGSVENAQNGEFLTKDAYILSRNDSFSRENCGFIYQIAMDYNKHLRENNLMDNNLASRELMKKIDNRDWEYSLAIIDEVQDYTQVNLNMFKKMSLKMFCVGDASQMVNPAYFSFSYLKNLLFGKDAIEIKELKNNFRNTDRIANIINHLGEVSREQFGTHNFVVEGKSIDSGLETTAVVIRDGGFPRVVASSNLDNFTFVVASEREKSELKKLIRNQEVLTVRDIKGLERDTVVLCNLLSSNIDKWRALERHNVNHKSADENSIYRYYYNLFYVGLSRAKQNIFVVESRDISQFNKFLNSNFENLSSGEALARMSAIVSSIEFTQEEVYDRIYEFIRLGQYENARFALSKVLDDNKRIGFGHLIDINESMISKGKYREAGISLWEFGLIEDARKQFVLSGDDLLIELMDNCVSDSKNNLSINVLDYFADIKDDFARSFIVDTVKKDLGKIKEGLKETKNNFKERRR